MRRVGVIMAGGSGTRLWPLSRAARPKQLLKLIENRSLLRASFERLRLVLVPEDIYVVLLADYIEAAASELPELPKENLIGEPMPRDTANAIALAASLLHSREPETTMGVFTADHFIRPIEVFAEVVRGGFEAAESEPDALITFGIKPTHPHTGMGYIQRGEPVSPGVWEAKSFKEKPDLVTARQYLSSGGYYWNSGMFVWRTKTVLDQIAQHLPETHSAMMNLAASWTRSDRSSLARAAYESLPKISIDFAVMEKAPKVRVVEMALDWLDVGSWAALPAVAGADATGTTKAVRRFASLGSRNNIVVSEEDHLIAAIGVQDLVIVHSPDATLICHRDQVERIKELVAQLQADYRGHYS